MEKVIGVILQVEPYSIQGLIIFWAEGQAHSWVIGKRCVWKVWVCVWTHFGFHQVSLTCQTLGRMVLGIGWRPRTGIVRGCSHTFASQCTDVHLFHIHLYLQRKNIDVWPNGTRHKKRAAIKEWSIDSVQHLWLWEHTERKVLVLVGSGGGCAYPGTVWFPAAGILQGTHRRTSLVHSHTGIGTGNWSSCTRRCLSSCEFRFY